MPTNRILLCNGLTLLFTLLSDVIDCNDSINEVVEDVSINAKTSVSCSLAELLDIPTIAAIVAYFDWCLRSIGSLEVTSSIKATMGAASIPTTSCSS